MPHALWNIIGIPIAEHINLGNLVAAIVSGNPYRVGITNSMAHIYFDPFPIGDFRFYRDALILNKFSKSIRNCYSFSDYFLDFASPW